MPISEEVTEPSSATCSEVTEPAVVPCSSSEAGPSSERKTPTETIDPNTCCVCFGIPLKMMSMTEMEQGGCHVPVEGDCMRTV